MRHIIIERYIPGIRGLVEPWARVTYLSPEEFTAGAVRDADALLVRTRTRCDAALLDGSRVSLVATATIGTDHIDLDYCSRHGIEVVNAPGCNAPAVAQWVWAVIGHWLASRPRCDGAPLTLGVIGVGHVGGIVARWGRQMGMNVLQCDPPRARAEGGEAFVPLDHLLTRSDVVTLHTPLTHTGRDATCHLIDGRALSLMGRCRLLLNAARGGIVDERALAAWAGDTAIDCWEGEPSLDPLTLARARVATPHIAGYSLEGKLRATAMIVEALNSRYGWSIEVPRVDTPMLGAARPTLETVMASYNPMADTVALKARPDDFEGLRNRYTLRHEVSD